MVDGHWYKNQTEAEWIVSNTSRSADASPDTLAIRLQQLEYWQPPQHLSDLKLMLSLEVRTPSEV